MKKVLKDKIINIENTPIFDNKFLFSYLDSDYNLDNVEVFYMSKLLKEKENTELLNNLNGKFAMYSEVYSPKDELEIFQNLYDYSINNNKKIHIIGITLKEELDILEDYYIKSGFLRTDVNCFIPDFKNTLITVSVNIENLIWRGSDYKANGKNIYFVPPVRESGQNKAMFKGINRGSIAGIYIKEYNDFNINFLQESIKLEQILPLTFSNVFKYNLEEIGFNGKIKELIINY
ncbi:MAG: hypothetical protein PHV23_05480 [Candidatus Gracilibacteria bacterium]|nr:hypothetical protein [Candidatus Gracilibacteria bacterium]